MEILYINTFIDITDLNKFKQARIAIKLYNNHMTCTNIPYYSWVH